MSQVHAPLREYLNLRELENSLMGPWATLVMSIYVVVKNTLRNPESVFRSGGRKNSIGFVPNPPYPSGNNDGVPFALICLRGASIEEDGGVYQAYRR